MIVTVTLNPSVDHHINIQNFNEGQTLSSYKSEFYAGGKGINVSRVLNNLNRPTTALAMIGGFTGEYILSQSHDLIKPIFIRDTNRINTKIQTSQGETEIHDISPEITTDEIKDLCTTLHKIKNIEILVLSGSIPSCLSSDTYKKIVESCPTDTKIIIDTRGEALKESMDIESIFLVKPNKHELAEFYNYKIISNTDALKLAKRMKEEHSIEHLILSLGEDGAYFLFNNKTYYSHSPKGLLISSVGSGDSVIAGFIHKYIEEENALDAFKYSIACGTGTAFSHGLCTLDTATQLYSHVEIIEI